MGFFERAHAAGGAGAVLDAEQLFLHALGRHGGGTQRHEGAGGA